LFLLRNLVDVLGVAVGVMAMSGQDRLVDPSPSRRDHPCKEYRVVGRRLDPMLEVKKRGSDLSDQGQVVCQ
jgi:hypothetical protein